jgi:hypothetical protein
MFWFCCRPKIKGEMENNILVNSKEQYEKKKTILQIKYQLSRYEKIKDEQFQVLEMLENQQLVDIIREQNERLHKLTSLMT